LAMAHQRTFLIQNPSRPLRAVVEVNISFQSIHPILISTDPQQF